MRWLLLAKTEFKLLLQSRGSWLTFPVVLLTGLVIGTPHPEVTEAIGATAVVAGFQSPVVVFGGFAGLLVSYRAVSYERESGRILLIGSLPFERHGLVLGKVVGRTAGVAVPMVLAIVCGYVVGVAEGRVASPIMLFGFVLFTVCYLAATVSVGVGLSTVSRSSRPAVGGVIGYFLILTVGWVDLVSVPVYTGLTGRTVVSTRPPADVGLFLLQRATPSGAFSVATNWLFEIGNSSASFNAVVLQSLPRIRTNALLVGDAFSTDVPFLLAEPLSLLVLAVWVTVPVVGGICAFERVDLP